MFFAFFEYLILEGKVEDMSRDLIQAYLDNAQVALAHNQVEHACFLLAHTQEILGSQHTVQYPVQLRIGIGLDPGKKRRTNEDCVFGATSFDADGELFGLFLVTDGAGGHVLGQQAARLALHTCVDYLFPRLLRGQRDRALQPLLVEGIQHANHAIYLQNEEATLLGGRMCTTITVLLIVGSQACVANVGDSRAYHYHHTYGLTQITRDHSFVAELVQSKGITRDESRTHPQRHVIYRGLGKNPVEEVDIFSGPIQIGDTYLLCSDGLWEMVPDKKIGEILSSSCPPCEMSAQLISQALAGGGSDNISAIVVQVLTSAPPPT